MHIYWY